MKFWVICKRSYRSYKTLILTFRSTNLLCTIL